MTGKQIVRLVKICPYLVKQKNNKEMCSRYNDYCLNCMRNCERIQRIMKEEMAAKSGKKKRAINEDKV